MAGKITNYIIESHLKCNYKAHLLVTGEQGVSHDYETLMRESRERIRQAASLKLFARHNHTEVPTGQVLTTGLLNQGLPLLWNVVHEDREYSLRFDALIRTDDMRVRGAFHYLPVLIHESEKVGVQVRLVLALHAAILASVQGRDPPIGFLFHGQNCQERKIKLVGLAALARRHLREIRNLKTEGTPSLILNSHCHVCQFRKACRAEAIKKDDLSLLGLTKNEINKYAKRGVFTTSQLSFTFRARRRRPPGQNQQIHQHSLQALAVREKKVHILGSPGLPDSQSRLYLDIEGDPDRGFDYLLGMVLVVGGAEKRHSFWADSAADELALLKQFLSLVSEYRNAWIYTYGSYELNFLRRVSNAHGLDHEVEPVLGRVFNVLSVIHPHIYFPVYSNGLKDIGAFLGFEWSEPLASGIQSIVWRRQWEETSSPALKSKLTTYNFEDCSALAKVTEFLYASCDTSADTAQIVNGQAPGIIRVEDGPAKKTMHGWNESIHGVQEFEYTHERSSFDYLKDRICVRSGRPVKKKLSGKRKIKWKKHRRVNCEVEIESPSCPNCGGTKIKRRPNRALARLAFDLRLTKTGIRSHVTRYRTAWHHCKACRNRFLPPDYLRLKEFCHSLQSWAMYEHVEHRAGFVSIAQRLRDCFGLPIVNSQAHDFKVMLARYYERTYQRLQEKIVQGNLIHVDETEIHVRKLGKAYVWVFTNLEEVVFVYRRSREGGFLHEMLKDFQGVLVSDFYAAYDSLSCAQQKCLIHLLRDFNQDILANPWDEELKSIGRDFGSLLKAIVATVDRYGLRKGHLGKHQKEIDRLYRAIEKGAYRSEKAENYRHRLVKYWAKLFTFINNDGIPWHNNGAEHAVKAFANYRERVDSLVSEAGLAPYLVLLSIQQTCKYKGINFLKFMLSQETDIDAFTERTGKPKLPAIELYPVGSQSNRQSRGRLNLAPTKD